jgi:hypothetical protein
MTDSGKEIFRTANFGQPAGAPAAPGGGRGNP